MKVPYYTTTTYPGARLVLDDQGLPVYQGLASVTFTVRMKSLVYCVVDGYWLISNICQVILVEKRQLIIAVARYF